KLPLYDIELSYESGCDIYKMIQWLNTPEGRGTVGRCCCCWYRWRLNCCCCCC
ncbi:unnamed protein product, partial [Rotaria sp. Silwood1]